MRRVAPVLACLALAACGGSWSDDDVAFLRALPTRGELALDEPGAQEGTLAQPLLGRSVRVAEVVRVVRDVNRFVTVLTAGLDLLRTLPPTSREADRRTWGPYPDRARPNVDWQVTLVREAPGVFAYELAHRRGGAPFEVTISGRFEGTSASRGKGALTYDVTRGRALALDTDAKNRTVHLSWDRASGEAIAAIEVEAVAGASALIEYRQAADGGQLTFDLTANLEFTRTGAQENLLVVGRWLRTGAGRVDMRVSGGDLGGAVGEAVECWNADNDVVYAGRNFECRGLLRECADGEAAACAFGPLPSP